MPYLTLDTADRVYLFTGTSVVQHHSVASDDVREAMRQLRTFTRLLGEQAQDDDWKLLLRALRRYRFEICAAPLPHNAASLALAGRVSELDAHVARLKHSYPLFFDPAREL